MTSERDADKILKHQLEIPLLERLRGQSFIPGVHYASQAEAWMLEAANEIETMRSRIDDAIAVLKGKQIR